MLAANTSTIRRPFLKKAIRPIIPFPLPSSSATTKPYELASLYGTYTVTSALISRLATLTFSSASSQTAISPVSSISAAIFSPIWPSRLIS